MKTQSVVSREYDFQACSILRLDVQGLATTPSWLLVWVDCWLDGGWVVGCLGGWLVGWLLFETEPILSSLDASLPETHHAVVGEAEVFLEDSNQGSREMVSYNSDTARPETCVFFPKREGSLGTLNRPQGGLLQSISAKSDCVLFSGEESKSR
jgi:hypothetical protein